MSDPTETLTTSENSIAKVRMFLDALAAEDLDTAFDLITDDIAWHNTSLPTMHGRSRVRKIFAGLKRPSLGFDVTIHHIAADGHVVLTERTDIIRVGRVTVSFWVCGTFHLRDGRIAVWDDHFAVGNFVLATIRGVFLAAVGRK